VRSIQLLSSSRVRNDGPQRNPQLTYETELGESKQEKESHAINIRRKR
jgi:hypothetical protein